MSLCWLLLIFVSRDGKKRYCLHNVLSLLILLGSIFSTISNFLVTWAQSTVGRRDRKTPHYVGTTSLAHTSLNSLGKIRLTAADMIALCLRSIRCMHDTTEKGEELIFTLHHQCHQCPCGAVQLPFSCDITSGMGNMSLLRLSLFFGPWKNPPFLSLDIEKDEGEKKRKWAKRKKTSLPLSTCLLMTPAP